MKFPGFSLPDGAFVPPELIYLMPHISGGSLKVLLAILYNNLQIGGGERPSLADLEKYTGLSKRQLVRTTTELLEAELIERQAVGQSYTFALVVNGYDKMSYLKREMSSVDDKMSHLESESDESVSINNLKNLKINFTDSTDSTTTNDKISLLKKLRACGVYLKTAQAIVEANTPEEIEQQLEYYRYALKANMAQGPGWLVLALKEKWPAPLGYVAEADPMNRYREWDSL